jgi:ribosome-associated translation inhibitor RaiA
MNIPIPKGMKSPTVIIVGNQEPNEKHNGMAMARMDNLERKLDAQYKSFIDKTDNSDYIKVIQSMQSSFTANFNKMLSMNKSMMTQSHQERFNALRNEFNRSIKSIEDKDTGEENLKILTSKLNSLENAIKSITLKPQIVKVQSNTNNKQLLSSFDSILQRMENTIRSSRPRLTPSPS